MPFIPPSQASDIFDISQSLFGGGDPQAADGFQASGVPTATGLGTRTGRLPANRPATTGRKLMHWLVPDGPIVEMYMNPQSVTYTDKKKIEKTRTKGGFVLQYWGEELTGLTIEGTTGTSGIEGINVLRDIYRNEQIAFDPYALFLAEKQQRETFSGDIFGATSAIFDSSSPRQGGETFLSTLAGASQEAFPQPARQSPNLASLAFQVEMFWSGEVYRGFFDSFKVTESVQKLGMFDYTIEFVATQKRGFRQNFLAWHRSPVLGPSNSHPEFGTPYSFGQLIDGNIAPPRRQAQPDVIEEFEVIGNNLRKAERNIREIVE